MGGWCACASPTGPSSAGCSRRPTTGPISARPRPPPATSAPRMGNNPYSPHTDADRAAMLARVGVASVDELLGAVPADVRRPAMGVPPGMAEAEVQAHLERIAARDRSAGSGPFFIGGPVQRRYIPAAVSVLALRGEFLTAYTPYQPEVSQGTLQAIWEYQSVMCELLAMDVVNSSMYDGSTAVAEGALMAVRLTGRRLVVVQAIADAAHAAGALCVQVTEPHANALIEPPGALGADIAVGEGQPLGIPMSFGGPHLGIFASREALVRQMPGRIVGQTVDANGTRGFVNTLQTREQHIRREKATSNICTNEAIAAITAAVYLSLLGPEGLRAAARVGVERAHRLAGRLEHVPGLAVALDGRPFLDRFPLSSPLGRGLRDALRADGILAGEPSA